MGCACSASFRPARGWSGSRCSVGRGDARPDRDDRPTGIFRASFDVYPTALMAAEQGRFYRGLRAAAGEPLAYHGVDIDGLPGGGYADIEAALAPRAAEPAVGAFLAGLARVSRRDGDAGVAPGWPRLTPPPDASAEVDASLRAMAESLAYVDDDLSGEDLRGDRARHGLPRGLHEAPVRRCAAADRRRADGLMGHALHLAKDDRLLGKTVGVGPGGGIECSLGHHLVQVLGLKAASIWLVHGEGEDSQPFPTCRAASPTRPTA